MKFVRCLYVIIFREGCPTNRTHSEICLETSRVANSARGACVSVARQRHRVRHRAKYLEAHAPPLRQDSPRMASAFSFPALTSNDRAANSSLGLTFRPIATTSPDSMLPFGFR